MTVSVDSPNFPLSEVWWLPRLRRLLSPPIPEMESREAGTPVEEAAPAYGRDLTPGFCASLAERGKQAAVCLLPDGQTLLLLEYFLFRPGDATASGALSNRQASWAFDNPDGMFCFTKNGGILLTPPETGGETMDLRSPWVNLGDHYGMLGIYGTESFLVRRTPGGEDGRNRDEFFCLPPVSSSSSEPEIIDRGTVLVSACPVDRQQEIYRSRSFLRVECGCSKRIRLVCATGRDNRVYLFAACFSVSSVQEGESFAALTLPPGRWRSISSLPAPEAVVESSAAINMHPGQCRIWVEYTE